MMIVLLVLSMVAGLAVAAFCAGTETGIFTLSLGRVVHMAREGSPAAKILQAALSDKARALTCLLVGNNLASVVFSSASAALAARLFAADSVGARTAWSVGAAFTMLVLGEFTPKLLCSASPLRRTLALAPFFRVFAAAMYPLTMLAMALTSLFEPRKGGSRREKVTPDDLLQLLRDRKDGVRLTDFESALIGKILVLRKKGEPVTPESLLSAIDDPKKPNSKENV